MKAELHFDLDNQDDKIAHLRCVKALDMACALFEIELKIRKEGKQFKLESFIDVLERNNINLDEILE